ncbi:hypothetical protein BCR44DRAFT_1422967 [Catenaria anguillulae PL171]|uniref:THO complex subunit 2 n=1 Tax=Catenaria anguillulae PL171 TaxID=765915 RepID=A0A1Y2I3S2_9FUNG|nr:hypothetical protein BCR44DRAFT_1422967 [Catenaria anguillulae PL171]
MQSPQSAQSNEQAQRDLLGTLTRLAGTPPQWTPALKANVIRTLFVSLDPSLQPVSPNPDLLDSAALVRYLSEVFHLLRREIDPNVAFRRAKLQAATSSHTSQDAMDVDAASPSSEEDGHVKSSSSNSLSSPTSIEHQVLVALNDFFVTIKHQLCVIDGQYPGESKPEALVLLVGSLHAATWFPSHLLIESLSMPLLHAGHAIERKSAERIVQQHRTLNLFTLPIYSLAMEAPEGFMNLMVVLSEVLQAPLSVPPEADHTHPAVVKLAEDVWRKVDQIIAIHLLSRVRVAETLLRAFAVRIATHWPLFLALFVKLQFNQVSQIAGMTLRMMGSHTPGVPPPPLMVEDLDQFRADTLTSTRDAYINRLDRTLDVYANDVPKFMGDGSASATASSAMSAPSTSISSTDRDRGYAATFIDKALNNSTPLLRNMYLAVALLVRHGVVQLPHLLAHFVEPAEGPRMQDVVSIPLVDARPSVDQGDLMGKPTYAKPRDGKPVANADGDTLTPEQVAAKRLAVAIASLLVSMLAIGDVGSATKVMATYPDVDWCNVFPPVARQVLRVLDVATRKQCEQADDDEAQTGATAVPTVFTAFRRGVQRFFYPRWATNVPVGDLTFVFTLLDLVPEHLYLRPAIASRLCTLCMDRSPVLMSQVGVSVDHVLKRYLLPAMILGERNVSLSRAIWHLIKSWPADRRFALYASMPRDVYGNSSSGSAGPLVRAMGDQVDATVRYWMKRISKDVVHTYVRKLGKLALGNPVPVLNRIVATIMSYDNLGAPLLECLRYLDPLGMDVLMYTFLAALADPAGKANVYVSSQAAGRNAPLLVKSAIGYALKDDGINLESWWINTSQFMAAWLTNSPETDMDPLMAFLDHVDSVNRGQSAFGLADAQMLSDLVANMAGIPVIQDVSAQHIRALESAPCVTRRLLTSSIASSDVFNHQGRKGEDPLKVRARSTQALVRHLVGQNRAAHFLSHLRVLYATLAQRTRDWDDWDVKEKVKVTDLLAELQWKDRIKAALVQYATFLRLYVVPSMPEADGEPNKLRIQLDSCARWALVPADQVVLPSPENAGDGGQGDNREEDEPNGRELFWRLRLYHVHFEPTVYLPEEKEACEQHLADHTQAATMLMRLRTRVEKERRRIREAEQAASAAAAASASQESVDKVSEEPKIQPGVAEEGRVKIEAAAVEESRVQEVGGAIDDTLSHITSSTANGVENKGTSDVEMTDLESLASSTVDTISFASIVSVPDSDVMDVDAPVPVSDSSQPNAAAAPSAAVSAVASSFPDEGKGNVEKAHMPAPTTHPDDHINTADDMLPSASDLIRRAAESPADAEYASFWAAKVSPAVLLSVVQHAWSIRGMTEFESANVGILVAKALELLQKDADISPKATAEKNAAAHRAMRAHTSLFDFFVTVLGSGDDDRAASKTAESDDLLLFDLKPKPVAADVYLVRNTINLFKALTTARVFPAIHRHGSVLHKALDKLKENDSMRVLVLVLQGAINEVKSRRYPLERKLINEPPRRERERDRDREERKREANGASSRGRKSSSSTSKGDEKKASLSIPTKPTFTSSARLATTAPVSTPTSSVPMPPSARQPSPGRGDVGAAAPSGQSDSPSGSLVNHWASVASPLIPMRATSPAGTSLKPDSTGLTLLSNELSASDSNGRDSGEVTPAARLSPVNSSAAGNSSPSVWAARPEVIEKLRESASTPSPRSDSQTRRSTNSGDRPSSSSAAAAAKDTTADRGERERERDRDKDRPSSSRRRSRSRERRERSGRTKSRSKSPRERRRRSKDRVRDSEKRERGGARASESRATQEGTPTPSDRDRDRERDRERDRDRRSAKVDKEDASERKRSAATPETSTGSSKANEGTPPSRVRPRSDDADDANEGPDRKRAKLEASSAASATVPASNQPLAASANSSASSSSANLPMTVQSSPGRGAPPSIPRRPSGPLPNSFDAANRAHPSLPPAPAPLRSPPMGPTRSGGSSSLRDSYEPDRRGDRDRDRDRERDRSSRTSGDRSRRSYR